MVVTSTQQFGTIGGGHLELQAVGIARELLAGSDRVSGSVGALRRFPLGASLGQCCGGLVNLMFEAVAPSASQCAWLDEVADCRSRAKACILVSGAGHTAASGSLVVTADSCSGTLCDAAADSAARSLAVRMLAERTQTRLVSLEPGGALLLFDPVRETDVDIVLFGAGHVGRALARILAGLPCRVTWVDEREDMFADVVADNIRVEVSDTPLAEVAAARAGSYFLVMTHSHPLDQALAEAILRRADFRYFGLIGSLSKRRQFERRLAERGIGAEALARITCPIGIAGIDGKEPGAIAVAVAAQVLRLQAQHAAGSGRVLGAGRPGVARQ
jgi:xanthine dehydrogenase accessory factor